MPSGTRLGAFWLSQDMLELAAWLALEVVDGRGSGKGERHKLVRM